MINKGFVQRQAQLERVILGYLTYRFVFCLEDKSPFDGTAEDPQGNVKVRRIPYKIPLHPPLIKGDLRFPPLWKGGLGGILKSKTCHIKNIMLNPILTLPCEYPTNLLTKRIQLVNINIVFFCLIEEVLLCRFGKRSLCGAAWRLVYT